MKVDCRKIVFVTMLFLILKSNGGDAYYCFKTELLQNMTAANRLNREPFLTFDIEILTCCKYCKLHSLCKAVNFNRASFQCQLMSETPTPSNTIYDFDNILIDMENWKESFLGACKNHNCPNNTVCRELQGSYNCEVIGCTGFSDINNINSSSFERRVLWGFGEMVEYACERGYFPSSNPVCSVSGAWSGFSCYRFSVCAHVRKCKDMEERDFWLYVQTYKKLVKTFCKVNNGSFISLQHQNYASFSTITKTGPSCKMSPLDSPEDNGAGRTDFLKLKVNLQALRVSFTVHHIDNSFLNPQRYGAAKDCYPKHSNCSVLGRFEIDTRGTGLKFKNSLSWKTVGVTPVIENITRTMDGHVITGFCGGNCGGCEIDDSGAILEIDMNDKPPFESAELPICPFRVV